MTPPAPEAKKPGAPDPGRNPAAPPATNPPPASNRLFTRSFKLVLVVTFLAFGMEAVLRAVVPLIVLDRGGDAVAVGLVATAYSIPALLFRPFVGQLVDSWHHARLYRGGMIASTAVVFLLLVPAVPVIALARFLVGTGWAFFAVSNHSLIAKLAPPNRRAEASGMVITMPSLGALFLPSLGVALYTATGETAPILAGVAMGVGAAFFTFLIPVPPVAPRPATVQAAAAPSLLRRFVEPSAVAPTVLLVLSFTAWSLFTAFPPVFVQHLGAPVSVLVVYFSIFGLAQVASQPFFGRFADILGHQRSIIIGAAMSLGGLLIAAIPDAVVPGMVTFTAAAFIYALGQALLNPTVSAMVMERAPRHRLGSAMATFSIGYQFAVGTSSILWGAMITAFGFGAVFLVAAALQVLTIVLTPRMVPASGASTVA